MQVRSVEAIVRALNDAQVQCLIVGGLAVNAHGFVRFTRDVDIVLRLDPDNAVCGLKALFRAGYHLAVPVRPEEFADPVIRDQWGREKGMIVLKLWSDAHARTPVYIFIYEPFEFAAELKQATMKEVVPGVLAPIVSLPTLIQMKRAAGRPQDLTDITELQRMR